ncbi:MAG: DUF262 domain-containing protein [Bacteroidota bacterium]|nr:DUF262 domain-containing protein [Bacteroidota bacterium]
MSDFRISVLQNSSILYIYSERESIQLAPEYQRLSDVWSLEKRQFLLDSIINGYDIPKIYFHEFPKPVTVGTKMYRYAIIDGKQRLQSIWQFIDGEISLAEDFEFLHDSNIKAAGLSYNQLAQKYPKLKIRFDSTTLSIVTIQTEDIDLIEDMFSRLNEAAPLNAAEKRNAFPGPLPPAIRELARERFFSFNLPFQNRRYKHYEVATKFLYLEAKNGPSDTKKVYLDAFVRDYYKQDPEVHKVPIQVLVESTKKILNVMSSIFVSSDNLLKSSGMVTVYYLVIRNARQRGWLTELNRASFMDFDNLRQSNRITAEKDITQAKYDLLEFDRLAWSLNDSTAIDFCYKVMLEYLGKSEFHKDQPEI